MNNMTKTNFISLLPLFMVILIDVMGIVLVLPVLTLLILQPESGLLPLETPTLWRDFLYGFAIALYPLFMFFSTPILGDLSDQCGRKIILLICLFVSAASYFISAIGIEYHNLLIFLASRALAGLSAGTQPIASAAIIDASTTQNKTKNLSLVVLMSSVGLIIGPILGGLTAQKELLSEFNYKTPFILAGLISLLNMVFLWYGYTEKKQNVTKQTIHLLKGFGLFLSAFLQSKFRLLAILYFCFILAWSLYFQTINWVLMEKFHYATGQLGLFMGFIGLVFALTTSFIVPIFLKFIPKETSAYAWCILAMAIANIGSAIGQTEFSQWVWVILIAGSNVICYTLSLSLFSNLADDQSQGWIMGVTGSIGALTWAIGGVIAGPLGYLNIHLPLWTAGMLCLTSFSLMLCYQRQHSQ